MRTVTPPQMVIGTLLAGLLVSLSAACTVQEPTAQAPTDVPAAADGPRAGVEGWLAGDDRTVLFLRWTEADGQVSGTLRVAERDDGDVEVLDIAITGTVADGDITLTLDGGMFATRNVTGRLERDELLLLLPAADGQLETVALRPGNVAAFNARVRALADAADDARAAAEHSAAIDAANARIDAALDRIAVLLDRPAAAPAADAAARAERLHDDAVAAAVARLEETAEDAHERDFGRDDVRFAIDDVRFALDDVGFAVAEANDHARTAREVAAQLQDATAETWAAQEQLHDLAGAGAPLGPFRSLTGRAETRREEIAWALADLDDRVERITERARNSWQQAADVAQSAGVDAEAAPVWLDG